MSFLVGQVAGQEGRGRGGRPGPARATGGVLPPAGRTGAVRAGAIRAGAIRAGATPAYAARTGATLAELLLVIAVLGALASVALAVSRPSHTTRAARAVRSALLFGRAEAMWRGAAVSVTELPGAAGLVVRAAASEAAPCGAGDELFRVSLAEHAGVRLSRGLPRGIVWLPSGSGRSCEGGGVISATLELTDGRSTVAVVVSALGRARLEPR
ncbi:MAG: GspH/FimT family pseudopilin [Trueperaceae bacterium]|nr:GspH/FimT family pseudopilin [Trueperaceae bacterium]MCC6312201.1 GspH/FimT family pseudopilin [Trueperaceae bacterium]MCO5174208.1 GspH/FimT family pseudopilin [Trueperaceae bacterium]